MKKKVYLIVGKASKVNIENVTFLRSQALITPKFERANFGHTVLI